MNTDFKGVWIPKDIWILERITLQEKLFIVEITGLDNEKGCFASNNYFAKFFQITPQRSSQIIASLIKKKIIKADYEYKGKSITKRVLRIIATYKENFIPKKQTEEVLNKFDRGIKNPLSGYKENLIGYKGTFKDNNIDINISNNKAISKDIDRANKDSLCSNSLFNKDIDDHYETKPAILNILKAIKELGKFSTILPKNGNQPTKTFLRCVDYLKQIKSGMFSREMLLEDSWRKKFIKSWPDKNGYQHWREVKNIVIDSLQGFVTDAAEFKKAGGKLWFPKGIDKFFFNSLPSEPGKSMFLKYINIKPKSANENTAEWQKGKLPLDVQDKINEFMKDQEINWEGRPLLTWWSSMNRLYGWWKTNTEALTKYNRTYHDNGWGFQCGNAVDFFAYAFKYLSEEVHGYPRADPLPPNMGNAYWRGFRAYLLNGFDIEIDPDPEREKNIESRIKSDEGNEREFKIGNEMKNIEMEAESEGIDVPDSVQLREIAEKRLAG